jgi:sugar phosphate isomerase/epimerase
MDLSRRQVLGGAVAAVGAAVVAGAPAVVEAQRATASPKARPANEPFGYCLNTSTIRGNTLDIAAEVDAIAKAGFDGIEPWVTELDAYTAKGGSLDDLRKRIADAGLVVENVIAFNSWLSDDATTRAASMEKIKVDMDKVVRIGGTRLATPPGGGRRGASAPVSLDNAATYYRAALELGQTMGVTPLCELWSSHPVLGPLSHGAYVAIQTGRADASLLLDVIHLYRAGTAFESLGQVNGRALHVLHVNDYPEAPDPKRITDAQRIYPGDGLAPYGTILRAMRDNGFRGALSLELFNRDYYQKGAAENLKTGLAKIKEQVQKALA